MAAASSRTTRTAGRLRRAVWRRPVARTRSRSPATASTVASASTCSSPPPPSSAVATPGASASTRRVEVLGPRVALPRVELVSIDAEARASFEFRLLDQATGQSAVVFTQATPLPFSTKAGDGSGGAINRFSAWSAARAKKRTELEASAFMRDDCLFIECDVIVVVVNEPRGVEETAIIITTPSFEVPPLNLSENLGRLLEEKKGADVAFKVGDEVFAAHKMMLASRSPAFDAELFGSMAESTSSGQRCIPIEDMHPDVFRALLHFIYTDTMPAVDMGELDDGKEITRHLLVAADRYGMERLKVMCEAILCERIDIDNVATLLALADQHHCKALGNACAVFIAASSNRMGNVVASQGYVRLKRACPDVLVDVLERVVTKCLHRCKK